MVPDDQQNGAKPEQHLKLPTLVFGVAEIRRLRRELEALDEFMRQAAIREPGKQAALPRVSRLLDALAIDNGRNLLQESHRQDFRQFLIATEQTAPTVHISFASDPSSAFTAKLVTWLRSNIHPTILLQVGLQPAIAAGCIMRTSNKNFDLSLRQSFEKHRSILLQALDADRVANSPVPASTPQPEAVQA